MAMTLLLYVLCVSSNLCVFVCVCVGGGGQGVRVLGFDCDVVILAVYI